MKDPNYGLVDMIGVRKNELLVIARAANTHNGQARWLCKCSCGQTKVILGKHIRSGAIKSCGCIKKNRPQNNPKNMAGLTINELTAIEFLRIDTHRAIWKFQCSCKKYIEAAAIYVRSGNTKSCGCLVTRKLTAICHPEKPYCANNMCRSCVRIERERKIRSVADGSITPEIRAQIYSEPICTYCKEWISRERRTLDHIIPLNRGGLHTVNNVTMACHKCNVTKQDRTPEEWQFGQPTIRNGIKKSALKQRVS